ncbi:MAG TPA: right-handed parallel beta-helix repeat-containing protein [Nitrospiria bacterium]|nr:right-handed parallel beta-helix repeat-containing protein [Candidatus Manganitrophaceae bacterium]HIL35033.1 right-handed parallel beta-helix repeat-containing protein [Candidatus Manganitrophaceae bacterium]
MITLANPDLPVNPKGGKTLIVDAGNSAFYPLPSAAFEDAKPDDQVYVRPGVYEDQLFIVDSPIQLVGAGKDQVEIFYRRGAPLYLQKVPEGLISGITFRYVGSDQHSAMNLLNSTCTITACRIKEGIQSGIVIYGPESRATLADNEVCSNRESGIFIFGGAHPYIRQNFCYDNHHFGIAIRDAETCPDLVRNNCRNNMLSGILMFHYAEALVLENHFHDNHEWCMVITPDSKPSPERDALATANRLSENPRGGLCETNDPLRGIGR